MAYKNKLTNAFILVAPLALLLGCGISVPPVTTPQVSSAGASYLLSTEPAAAQSVKQVRSDTKDTEEVTIVGRIGGDTNPWIENQAAFLIVDSSLKPCNEQHDDACPTPWDYCCDAGELSTHKLMVKVVDAKGSPVATDARKLLGLKELQTIVVRGQAKRDEAGNLTVLASGIFVRP